MNDRRRELSDVRRQMAQADLDLLRALEKRFHLARQVRAIGVQDVPVTALSEAELDQAVQAAGISDLPREAARDVLQSVHALTTAAERSSRVTYLQPEGSYAHLAAWSRFDGADELVASPTVAECLDRVVRRRADYCVIPLESSYDGAMNESVDALAATDLLVIAKVELPAVLSLMRPPSNEPTIERVFAFGRHRIAAQRVVADLPPDVLVSETPSPLAAARLALETPHAAAIVPQSLGERLGLVVGQSNVSDRPDLRLRFGVVSIRPTWRSGNDVTALLFGAHDEPGALYDVLKHFVERGINLKSIQSRPMPGQPWAYQFYLEVSGHVTDRPVVTALEEIKRKTKFVKVLGSFPAC